MGALVAIETTQTWQYWAKLISVSWQKGVESIVEVGTLLIRSKGALKEQRGCWEAMVNLKLPFGPRTAQRLIAIANHPVLSNPTHGSLLPPSWRTLYELTRFEEPKLITWIHDGTINPKMERKDVVALKPQKPPRQSAEKDHPDKKIIALADELKTLGRKEKTLKVIALMQALGVGMGDIAIFHPDRINLNLSLGKKK